jgi:hypothetical protein
MFECRGCESKDKEIGHLRSHVDELLKLVERAQARVTELADPGIGRRINPPAPGPGWRETQDRFRIQPQYPGYEPRPEPAFEVTDGVEKS